MTDRDRTTRSGLLVGQACEVHTKFDGSWCSGFEIAEVVTGGYRVRRAHDRTMLPGTTGPGDVRAARPGSVWR